MAEAPSVYSQPVKHFHYILFGPFTAGLSNPDVHSLHVSCLVPIALWYIQISMQTEFVVSLPWSLPAMSGVTNDPEGFVESYIT